MKDQYVGDINDYYKYALLRALGKAHAGRMVVCWMLTDPDGRRDGSRLAYLSQPDAHSRIDPPLFEALRSLVAGNRRSVAEVQAASVLPEAVFVDGILSDSVSQRSTYFETVWRGLQGRDFVFFDPDNGLAVKSVPRGRRGSSKYLYWEELERAADANRSVCVYQHFPRVQRERFILGLLGRVKEVAPQHRVFALHTTNVAYLIAAGLEDGEQLLTAAEALAGRFAGRLRFLAE